MMYQEYILSKIKEYCKLKNIAVDKKSRNSLLMIHCPFCESAKDVNAPVRPRSTFIRCYDCKKEYNLLNVVKKIEPDKSDWADEKIFQYLKEVLKLKVETETDQKNSQELLDFYEKMKFDLVPIVKGQKYPIEKGWTAKEHKQKEEWERWLVNGLNIGIKTGACSGVTVLDLDTKEIPDEFKPFLETETLTQDTLHGHHYFYQFEPDLPKTRIDDLKIDLETTGGQVVVAPSVTDNAERKFRKLITPIKMPKELKDFLLAKVTVPRKTNSEKMREDIETGDFKINSKDLKLINDNLDGCCNSSFIKLGGILRKELSLEQTKFVLNIFNNHLLEEPMDDKAIRGMVNEIDKYIKFDEQELAHHILAYLKDVKISTKSDLELVVSGNWTKGEAKKRLNKILAYLMKEEKIIRKGKNEYQLIEALGWQDTLLDVGVPINFKMPYLHEYAYFNWGDLIVVASKTKYGKTHLAMNMIKRLVSQKIKPYYMYSESGGRFAKVALHLKLHEGQFNHAFLSDPRKIILPKEEQPVIVYDWLRPPDFAKLDNLFGGLVEKIKKVNGIMIIFMQLKHDNNYFAENLLAQYPALVCKYLYEKEEDGTFTKFHITEIRDGKLKGKSFDVPCKYFWETKEVKMVSEIDNQGDKK